MPFIIEVLSYTLLRAYIQISYRVLHLIKFKIFRKACESEFYF